MSRELMVIDADVVQGVVVSEHATLDALDMMYMNFAREEFNKLNRILLPLIEPLLCQEDNTVVCDISRHLEQIRSFSGNFCWKHRDVGASHGVVGGPNDLEGGAQ